jgi:hypothetical protein
VDNGTCQPGNGGAGNAGSGGTVIIYAK